MNLKHLFRFLVSAMGCMLLCVSYAGCGDGGTHLVAEKVIVDDDPEEGDIHNLFSLPPGKSVRLSSLNGAADLTGTTIVDDFDGDGIVNGGELVSNAWVSDYPSISCSVSPPVTMKVELLYRESGETREVISDISSSDTERTVDRSMEDIHRQEVNERTVQYQDSYNIGESGSNYTDQSEASSSGRTVFASVSIMGTGGGGGVSTFHSSATSSTVAEAFNRTYGESRSFWRDVPFKNDLNQNGWTLKDTSAVRGSQNLRRDMRGFTSSGYEVKSDGGCVRAALYITNGSVNMPVRLSDILCSLMFESPDGQLVPIQSFRLRNDDYSIFEIDLYGGDTFGPYVIDLAGLNTAEIMDAIRKGCRPRIFIVNYRMRHVSGSSWESMLASGMSVDNLKLIEENAKGRTAGIRIVGPGIRQFFRVAAFDTAGGTESRTGIDGAADPLVSPGISLEKALRRVSFSGTDIRYAEYILDFSGEGEGLQTPRIAVRGIYSIGSVKTEIPLLADPVERPDGSLLCLVKPLRDWTGDEAASARMWAVLGKGRYFRYSDCVLDERGWYTGYRMSMDAGGSWTAEPCSSVDGREQYFAYRLKGIESVIWPGDHYDLVCLDVGELMKYTGRYGTNPLETGNTITVNTRWDSSTLGTNPFDPDSGSRYLGEVAAGDTVELEFTVKRDMRLNPSFGTPVLQRYNDGDVIETFADFSYGYDLDRDIFTTPAASRLTCEQAVDFEISLGLGGEYGDWINLDPSRNTYYDPEESAHILGPVPAGMVSGPDLIPLSKRAGTAGPCITILNRSWDYNGQVFRIRIALPGTIEGNDGEQSMKLYIRPACNSLYRNRIWPVPADQLREFRATLVDPAQAGAQVLTVDGVSGAIEPGDSFTFAGESAVYSVESVRPLENKFRITLLSPLGAERQAGDRLLGLRAGHPVQNRFAVHRRQGFNMMWNGSLGVDPSAPCWADDPVRCPLGEGDITWTNPFLPSDRDADPASMVSTWIGGRTFGNPGWNAWTDASLLRNKKAVLPFPLVTGSGYSTGISLPSWELGATSSFCLNGRQVPRQTFLDPLVSTSSDGDRVFVVWVGGGSVMYRAVDMTRGIPLTSAEVTMGASSGASRVRSAVVADHAVAVWQTDDGNIRAAIADLDTGNTGAVLGVGTGSMVELVRCGESVMCLWHDEGRGIMARRIVPGAADPLSSPAAVVAAPDGSGEKEAHNGFRNPKAVFDGVDLIVTWITESGALAAVAFNTETGPAGDGVIVDTCDGTVLDFSLAYGAGRVLAAWVSGQEDGTWTTGASVLTATGDGTIESSSIVLDEEASAGLSPVVSGPVAAISGGRGVVMYRTQDSPAGSTGSISDLLCGQFRSHVLAAFIDMVDCEIDGDSVMLNDMRSSVPMVMDSLPECGAILCASWTGVEPTGQGIDSVCLMGFIDPSAMTRVTDRPVRIVPSVARYEPVLFTGCAGGKLYTLVCGYRDETHKNYEFEFRICGPQPWGMVKKPDAGESFFTAPYMERVYRIRSSIL